MKFPLTREPRKKNEKKDKKPYVKYGLSLKGKKKNNKTMYHLSPRREERARKLILKKIMADNFLNLGGD